MTTHFKLVLQFLLICSPFCEMSNTNLTAITWKHAVNSKTLLNEALTSDADMLEADVLLGTIIGNTDQKIIPIMAHPPSNTSDLSLEEFLKNVDEFNTANAGKEKGVKLDFKSIDAYEQSVQIVKPIDENRTYPLWVNADIFKGPVDPTNTPVDSFRFLHASTENFNRTILSVGWTTNFQAGYENETYTDFQIQEMLDTLKNHLINSSVTFPVRACFTANSYEQMKALISYGDGLTLTVWSGVSDTVNAEALRNVILDIGLDKVYLDVPDSLKNELHLDQPKNKVK